MPVEEGEDVRGFVGLAGCRLALPVAGFRFDANQDRMLVRVGLVDLSGIEPLTSSLRTRRSSS